MSVIFRLGEQHGELLAFPWRRDSVLRRRSGAPPRLIFSVHDIVRRRSIASFTGGNPVSEPNLQRRSTSAPAICEEVRDLSGRSSSAARVIISVPVCHAVADLPRPLWPTPTPAQTLLSAR